MTNKESSSPFTHVGYVCVPYMRGMRIVELRQTPKYWIDQFNTKYRKTDGCIPGSDRVAYLDLNNIKEKTK